MDHCTYAGISDNDSMRSNSRHLCKDLSNGTAALEFKTPLDDRRFGQKALKLPIFSSRWLTPAHWAFIDKPSCMAQLPAAVPLCLSEPSTLFRSLRFVKLTLRQITLKSEE